MSLFQNQKFISESDLSKGMDLIALTVKLGDCHCLGLRVPVDHKARAVRNLRNIFKSEIWFHIEPPEIINGGHQFLIK